MRWPMRWRPVAYRWGEADSLHLLAVTLLSSRPQVQSLKHSEAIDHLSDELELRDRMQDPPRPKSGWLIRRLRTVAKSRRFGQIWPVFSAVFPVFLFRKKTAHDVCKTCTGPVRPACGVQSARQRPSESTGGRSAADRINLTVSQRQNLSRPARRFSLSTCDPTQSGRAATFRRQAHSGR